MAFRLIYIITSSNLERSLDNIIETFTLIDHWKYIDKDHRLTFGLLTPLENTQYILDTLQSTIGARDNTRIIVTPVEAILPNNETTKKDQEKQTEEKKDDKENKKENANTSFPREELQNRILSDNSFNTNFVLLVILSSIVAAIGLLENNAIVLIGAMVIAPLLGPNLAMAFATTLGNLKLLLKSFLTVLVGILFVIGISYIISLIFPYHTLNLQLSLCTRTSFGGMIIAFASGAAAVLSLTTGLSSVLVGVMVAVALLPPASAIGIMIGTQQYNYALNAFLLLAVNLVCINLAANLVFLFKGVRPYHWYEKKQAHKAMFWHIALLILIFLLLGIIIYFR